MSNISITPEGEVSKNGEPLGTIENGVMTPAKKLAPVVKGQIKEAYGADLDFKPFEEAEAALQPEEESPCSLSNEDLILLFAERGLGLKDLPFSTEELLAEAKVRGYVLEQERVSYQPHDIVNKEVQPRQALTALFARVAAREVPPPPKQDPAAGDKDPAFVRWVKEHGTPEEFEEQYRNRKFTL